MNFKSHATDIRNLLRTGYRFSKSTKPENKKKKVATYNSGVYMLSRDYDDRHYKIGISKNLYNRLTDYKVCLPYPDEMWLQMVIITPSNVEAKQIEKELINAKKFKTFQGVKSKEWKILSKIDNIKNMIKNILQKHPELYTHIIVFNKNSWRVIKKGDEPYNLLRPTDREGKKKFNIIHPKIKWKLKPKKKNN